MRLNYTYQIRNCTGNFFRPRTYSFWPKYVNNLLRHDFAFWSPLVLLPNHTCYVQVFKFDTKCTFFAQNWSFQQLILLEINKKLLHAKRVVLFQLRFYGLYLVINNRKLGAWGTWGTKTLGRLRHFRGLEALKALQGT